MDFFISIFCLKVQSTVPFQIIRLFHMSYVDNHTTCVVFSGWLSSVFQIGKAAPPSPSKDRKKDMGSPLRNPGSPMRKNSQSDRRYLQIIHNTWYSYDTTSDQQVVLFSQVVSGEAVRAGGARGWCERVPDQGLRDWRDKDWNAAVRGWRCVFTWRSIVNVFTYKGRHEHL